MVGIDFIFDNKYLSDFGFIMANPVDDDNTGLIREILKGPVTSCRSKANHYGTVYSETITLRFLIVKNNCNGHDENITPFELRKLQAWLTCPQLPQALYVLGKDGSYIEYNGIFSETSPYQFDGLHGLNLVFTCDSPFAYKTRSLKFTADGTETMVSKSIFCDSDETNEVIYPTITFMPNGTKNFSISNNVDGQNMALQLPDLYGKVVIDCKLKKIVADGKPLSLSDVGYEINEIMDFNNVNTGIFKMHWPKLYSRKQNILTFIGNGDFIVRYKIPVKLGGVVNV